MEHFATHRFHFAGRTVEEGEDISETFDARTLAHFRVAGYAAAAPAAA
jgi:hypothetical protein